MLHLRRVLQSGLMLAVLLISPIAAFGQSSSLSGTVVDPQGNVVAGVTITVTNIATGAARATTSSKEGAYQIPQLTPGTYRVRAEGKGFASVALEDVQVLVSTPVTLNISFTQLGAVSETVTVQGGESVLNTSDATIGNTFDNTKVLSLPLVSRNVVGLLSLQPGVTAAVSNSDDARRGGYVNGARSDQSNVTLDGVDVNEQQGGAAFFSVLRSTPDSLQEFRVTTTNPNADQGRSSGAQVSLVTRSGSNQWHGSLFETHRNDITAANDWFNNKAGVERPKLLRNNFGGAIGGPIKKDKAFFFFTYEGFREAKGESVVREVPLSSLGQGIVRYNTADGASNEFGSCPAGTPGGVNCLNPDQIRAAYIDANGGADPGVNSLALGALADAASRFPVNDTTVGDGLNTGGFRFNASRPLKQNTFIARIDYNLNEKHNLFARGNYQVDTDVLASQFPDTPSPTTSSQPRGFVVGDAWTISNNLVNNLRYGLTRQSFTRGGDSDGNFMIFRFIYEPLGFLRPLSRVVPVHNITDDLSWTKGSHGFQFGTNIRLISNQRQSFANSFDEAIINPSFYDLSGDVLLTGADGPIFSNVGRGSDDLRDALASVIGRYTQYGANLNYDKDGSLLPSGTGIRRNFKTQEYDLYGQDSWRIRPNLTVTYGVRWSTSTPVYEANGLQVKPVQPLGDFFERRAAGAASGEPVNDLIQIDLAGKANNKSGFYEQDWNNFAPSVAVAWSPNFKNGFMKKIFGENKSTFRAGFRKVFDRLGGALAVGFDGQAILGFSSSSQISANTFTVSDPSGFGPLFTGLNQDIRNPVLPFLSINPNQNFPLQQPDDGGQRIESGLDDSIITPHSYAFNFSYGRDLGKGFSVEASYVGRLGRNLLVSRDTMHLNNLVDPASGVDFYTAMRQLIGLRERNATIDSVQSIPYFENIFPGLAGGGVSSTQTVYGAIARACVDNKFTPTGDCAVGTIGGGDLTDYTFLQLLLDDGLGFGDNLFFHPQYAAFGALTSIGTSDYHAFQTSFRKRFSNNLTFDFNYTLSHSFDIASGLEPDGSTIAGAALILNPLDLKVNRANSDFDVRHLINANYIYNLPFGKGQKLLSNLGSIPNFIIGGWQTTGIFRWNSGLPGGQPFDDGRWATNWNVQSNARLIRKLEASPTRTGDPNLFSDPEAAYTSYRNPYPGEIGDRNVLRDPGYFAVDFGLYKRFALPWEGTNMVFRWEVFNLTNTQRFTDVIGLGVGVDPFLTPTDTPLDFGRFTGIQGSPRQMQFALRLEF